jgi:hypothetical protein
MKDLCPTLRDAQPAHVKFDPTNSMHLEAFNSLCLGTFDGCTHSIKQHPTLRFQLQEHFVDVRSMMFHTVGRYHLLGHQPVVEADIPF